MEIFNVSKFAVGLNPHIQLNNASKRVSFGQGLANDTFESTSVLKLFDEAAIRKMISQNPEINKILTANKIPIRLNMTELQELAQNHCKDTQNIAAGIANNLPQALKQQVNMKDLKDGALLHDFGKVLIPPEILNKNGRLTLSEHKIMDLHSVLGYELLKNSGVNEKVLNLVKNHHNNVDTDFIPDVNLQILNLADKYSALTENRVYKQAYTPQKALTIIYGDVKRGNVHPFLFNALVKSVNAASVPAKQRVV